MGPMDRPTAPGIPILDPYTPHLALPDKAIGGLDAPKATQLSQGPGLWTGGI